MAAGGLGKNMRIGKYWLLRPYEAFGNRCEDIFLALLKCRREGLRLVLLKRKWNLFGKFRFRSANRALFELRHPVLVQNFYIDLLGYLLTLLWSVARILGLIWSKSITIFGLPRSQNFLLHFSEMEVGRNSLCGLVSVPYRSFIPSIDWQGEWSQPLGVRFRSRASLDETFPELIGRKYICLHVRTGDFFNDHNYSAPRNAEIVNYFPAIEWLVNRGFLIVRLGGPEMPRVNKIGLLDYAHDHRRSEELDIHLLEHCDAYIGSQTGPIDLAGLFEKKILTVNALSLGHCFWYREGSLVLPKHVIFDGNRLSVRERLDNYLFEITGTGRMDPRAEYQENTADEILSATQEFIKSPKLTFEQQEFNKDLRLKMQVYFETTPIWPNPWDDASQKLRWMSRMHNVCGSIVASQLEQEKKCD